MEMPAESYPRYSRRLNPLNSTSNICLRSLETLQLMYAKIPHIFSPHSKSQKLCQNSLRSHTHRLSEERNAANLHSLPSQDTKLKTKHLFQSTRMRDQPNGKKKPCPKLRSLQRSLSKFGGRSSSTTSARSSSIHTCGNQTTVPSDRPCNGSTARLARMSPVFLCSFFFLLPTCGKCGEASGGPHSQE